MVTIRAALSHSLGMRDPQGRTKLCFAPHRHSSQDVLVLHCLRNQSDTGKGSPALLSSHEPEPPKSAETCQVPELCTPCRKSSTKTTALPHNTARPLPFAEGDSLECSCFPRAFSPESITARQGHDRHVLTALAAAAFISSGLQECLGSLCSPVPITEIRAMSENLEICLLSGTTPRMCFSPPLQKAAQI